MGAELTQSLKKWAGQKPAPASKPLTVPQKSKTDALLRADLIEHEQDPLVSATASWSNMHLLAMSYAATAGDLVERYNALIRQHGLPEAPIEKETVAQEVISNRMTLGQFGMDRYTQKMGYDIKDTRDVYRTYLDFTVNPAAITQWLGARRLHQAIATDAERAVAQGIAERRQHAEALERDYPKTPRTFTFWERLTGYASRQKHEISEIRRDHAAELATPQNLARWRQEFLQAETQGPSAIHPEDGLYTVADYLPAARAR
ncbi:MAG: hypothetical protein ACYDBH_06485 [Acidobacteriaceae bacterium]